MLKVMQRGEYSCCTTTLVVLIDTHRIADDLDYFELLLLLCLVISVYHHVVCSASVLNHTSRY